MPYLETPDELADEIADIAEADGACSAPDLERCSPDATDRDSCRTCFVSAMAARIRNSVRNERLLNAGAKAMLVPAIGEAHKGEGRDGQN